MPEFHAEPFLQLAGLSHDCALITWGAFYFRVRSTHQWKLVDDSDLKHVHPPRRESIGARSEPYGPAVVRVYDADGRIACENSTLATNWCWVTGLRPDTRYTYDVTVKGEPWARDERWDWRPSERSARRRPFAGAFPSDITRATAPGRGIATREGWSASIRSWREPASA